MPGFDIFLSLAYLIKKIKGYVMALGTLGYVALGLTAASTAYQTVSAYNQGQAQAQNYRNQAAAATQQANIASANQRLAESEASAEKKAGYEEMQSKRLQAARVIGQQRAQMGGSGVAVDTGSFLDVNIETAMQGEISAINAYNQGIDRAYTKEIEAWNYANQAAGYQAQAKAYKSAARSAKSSATWNALGTALTGFASMANSWGTMTNWGVTTAGTPGLQVTTLYS